MNTGMKILIAILIGLVLTIGSLVMFVLNAKFTAEKYENSISAIYQDMNNVYANAVVETLQNKPQIINKYKNDLVEVVKANMERYKNDQNVVFKAISEQAGMTLDPSLYKELQTSINVAFTKFENSQREKIDKVRVYKDFLNASISGMIAKFFGYPSEQAKMIMEKLIINQETTDTFKSGKMERMDLFKAETK